MQVDIDQLMYQAVSKDNDGNELKDFSQRVRQSTNEHLISEHNHLGIKSYWWTVGFSVLKSI